MRVKDIIKFFNNMITGHHKKSGLQYVQLIHKPLQLTNVK